MTAQKYLFLYRNPVSASNANRQPSPEEMQQMFAQWNVWKDKFKAEILDMGDGLKPEGKILKAGAVTDGPFIEAKEVMGGFSIIQATSIERAIEVARSCPITLMPGASIEIRPMAGF